MCGKKTVLLNHSGSSSELVDCQHFSEKLSSLFPCLSSDLKPGSGVFHWYFTISTTTYETALAKKQILVPFDLILRSWISEFYTTHRSQAEESLCLLSGVPMRDNPYNRAEYCWQESASHRIWISK